MKKKDLQNKKHIFKKLINNKLSFAERLKQQLNLKEKNKNNEQADKIFYWITTKKKDVSKKVERYSFKKIFAQAARSEWNN